MLKFLQNYDNELLNNTLFQLDYWSNNQLDGFKFEKAFSNNLVMVESYNRE